MQKYSLFKLIWILILPSEPNGKFIEFTKVFSATIFVVLLISVLYVYSIMLFSLFVTGLKVIDFPSSDNSVTKPAIVFGSESFLFSKDV